MARPANASMYQTPFHLLATAAPRHAPAPTRSHRMPSAGPPPGSAGLRSATNNASGGCGLAASAAAATLALVRSLSMISRPNAASTQNITKMSRSAVRDSTSSRPSSAISSPAMQPMSVDPVIRRTIRASIRIDAEPITATANRQPNGVSPNSHSPTAIMILPSGGWTTSSA